MNAEAIHLSDEPEPTSNNQVETIDKKTNESASYDKCLVPAFMPEKKDHIRQDPTQKNRPKKRTSQPATTYE
ncbi:hypothetical protein [Spirosoma sp. 209]|uniref:hypothetical protein n=1 Tax=Spirosoma sp. 209 TaxID=1955701 RepID=UPI00098D40E2|nr:hypothetical protein [Spirosoma sp. 209]